MNPGDGVIGLFFGNGPVTPSPGAILGWYQILCLLQIYSLSPLPYIPFNVRDDILCRAALIGFCL